MTHVVGTTARLDALPFPGPVLADPPPAGWIRGPELVGSTGALTEAIAACATRWRVIPPYAAAMLWKVYAYWAVLPAAAGWVRDRRIPDVSLDQVAVRLTGDTPYVELAFVQPGLGVLPTDPLAGRPGTVVLPSEDALLGWLTATVLESHLVPVGEAMRVLGRVGRRGLRGSVAAAFAHAVAETPRPWPRDLFAEAERLLGALGEPYARLVETVEVRDATGATRPHPLRRTCCLAFKTPDERYCSTCPLLSDAQREAMVGAAGYEWRRLNGSAAPDNGAHPQPRFVQNRDE